MGVIYSDVELQLLNASYEPNEVPWHRGYVACTVCNDLQAVVAVAMDYYDDYRAFVSAATLEKITLMYIRLTFLVNAQTMRQRYALLRPGFCSRASQCKAAGELSRRNVSSECILLKND